MLDIERVYDGTLSLRRAGRLAAALPPESAIYRGDTLDEKFLSMESRFLRLLFNVWVEDNDRMKSVDQEQAEAEKKAKALERNQTRALQALARQRAAEEV